MSNNDQRVSFHLNAKGTMPQDLDVNPIKQLVIPENIGHGNKTEIKDQLSKLKEGVSNKKHSKEEFSYYQTTLLPQFDKATSIKVEKPKSAKEMSNEEAFKVFKKKLAELGVTTTWRWEDTKRMLMKEDWAERLLPTMKERKRAFVDFIQDCKQRERNELKEKRQHIKDKFIELLREAKFVSSSSKYYDVIRDLMLDPRCKQLDERDREEIFQDYLDELERREKEETRNIFKKRIDNLKYLFEEKKISLLTSWDQAQKMFADNPLFQPCSNFERLTALKEYIENKEKIEYDEKRRIRKYNERKNREIYIQMLKDKFESKVISIKTKWNEFFKLIKEDPRYTNFVGQPGSTPHDLFDEFLRSEKEKFKKQKSALKQIIKNSGIKLSSGITFEDFDKTLNTYPEYSQLDEQNRKFLHQYVISKVRQKEEAAIKKYHKAIAKLYKFFRNVNATAVNNYQQYEKDINCHTSFTIIPMSDRVKIFEDYIKNGIPIDLQTKESSKDDKRKKKHRHYSHDHSDSDYKKHKKQKHKPKKEHKHMEDEPPYKRKSIEAKDEKKDPRAPDAIIGPAIPLKVNNDK